MSAGAVLVDGRWADPRPDGPFARDVLGIRRFASEVLARLPGVERLPHGLPVLHPLEPIWLTQVVLRRRPRVYFSPGFNPPLWSSSPVVFTICDLIHVRFPAESGPLQRAYYAAVVRPAARRARAIVTLSEFSKAEIVAWADVPEERVVVAGCGVGPEFRPDGPRDDRGYPYVLYAGNRKPHKNLVRLVEAFARAPLAADVRLVLTGPFDADTARVAAGAGIADRLVFAGRIPDDRMPALYRGARAVALPSLYEGFGLPALEAMACGVPVVASDTTSLPEVTGNAAITVDPRDVDAIAAGLQAAIEDEEVRRDCRQRGLERVQGFSWDRSARIVAATLAARFDG